MIAPAGDKLSASLSQGLSENICAVQSRGWSSKRNFDSPSVAGRCSCPFKSPPRRSGASCSFLLAEVREAWTLSVRWGGQPAAHTTDRRESRRSGAPRASLRACRQVCRRGEPQRREGGGRGVRAARTGTGAAPGRGRRRERSLLGAPRHQAGARGWRERPSTLGGLRTF